MSPERPFQPRVGQREILDYDGGRMGVAAVPGSGKTTTIAALAARLLAARARGEGPLSAAGQVLVVTYQTAAAESLRARIGRALAAAGVAPVGFDVRTLHSLAYGILRTWPGHAGTSIDFRVLDERSQRELVDRSVAEWSVENRHVWGRLAPGEGDYYDTSWEQSWARIGASVAHTVIGAAKNRRLDADALLREVAAATSAGGSGEDEPLPLRLLRIGAEIYARYQTLVETSGAIDFNDMVRLAVDLLEGHADLAARLQDRWPVILEDEAQDSVPLQEELLGCLTAGDGHWIRVGDPNQSITSTFTAADPRFLRRFLDREDVVAIEMAVSGRCAPPIMDLANDLLSWVCDEYPVVEVREAAFRRQQMLPTQDGDPQPNPSADTSGIVLKAYDHRVEELTGVARRARRFAQTHPECTLAVLVPTNKLGYELADVLRQEAVPFDERLTTSRTSRVVIDAVARVLAFVADPLSPRTLEGAFEVTRTDQAETDEPLARLVRSCYRPESLLYPADGVAVADAFPPVEALRGADLRPLEVLAQRGRRWLEAASYPVDQLALAVAAELFEGDELARGHLVAAFLRRRADQNPTWRLPELAADLRRGDATREILGGQDGAGYEPQAGELTLTTMHKAKGMEWDLVYLVGVDGVEFPGTPDDYFRGHQQHLGGDPAEMARAELDGLLTAGGQRPRLHAGQIEYIAERLRLLYVAITRARRYLAVSFSRSVPVGQRTRTVGDALAFHRMQTLVDRRRGSAANG